MGSIIIQNLTVTEVETHGSDVFGQFLRDFSLPIHFLSEVEHQEPEKTEMKAKIQSNVPALHYLICLQLRAVSFKAVCWEGPAAMPLEFLLFFVIGLLTPETGKLICANKGGGW